MELLPCALCLSLQIRKRKDPGENPGWKTNSQKSAAHCQHRLTDVEGRHSGQVSSFNLVLTQWISALSAGHGLRGRKGNEGDAQHGSG